LRHCFGRATRCASAPARKIDSTRALRTRVLFAYGGRCPFCACCGETRLAFLTLDHVNGAGRAHRRLRKGWQGVYRGLVRDSFPGGFQLLCFNCNIARGLYGSCPHARTILRASIGIPAASLNLGMIGDEACARCGNFLPNSAFYRSKLGRGGLQSRCRVCTREASSARLRAARLQALSHYAAGDVSCQCCGEREELFLALDHIDGRRTSPTRSARWWEYLLCLAEETTVPARSSYPLPQLQLRERQEPSLSTCAKHGVTSVCDHGPVPRFDPAPRHSGMLIGWLRRTRLRHMAAEV
jgi:hypothetical protein